MAWKLIGWHAAGSLHGNPTTLISIEELISLDIDDCLIVDELKKRSSRGPELLVNKYQDLLYNWGIKRYDTLTRQDVAELVNDTFFRVVDKIDSFQFKSEKGFVKWVLAIFANLVKDHIRRKKKVAEHMQVQPLEGDSLWTSEKDFDKARWELDRKIYTDYMLPEPKEHPLAPKVDEFLASLDEKKRTILQACAMGISHREIAEWTGIPNDHIKVYYSRLKEKLREYLLKEKS